jgi:hypothetical protein
MKKKKCMQTHKGSKKAGSFQFNNACEYPIFEDAQKLINVLKNGCDESSLYYLRNCFRGFSRKMQRRMVESLLDEYGGRIDGKTRFSSTGVDHVDLLLLNVIDKIDHDTKNLQYNEY